MKWRLFMVVLMSLAPGALAQGTLGTVFFANRLTSVGLDAPFFLVGWQRPGPAYSAGLYYEGLLIPSSVTRFRDGSENPLLASYIEPVVVPLPGTVPGQQNVPVEMRAWLASAGSYENAGVFQRATSGPLIIAMLGGDIDPTRPNHLPATFTGNIPIWPEPSTIALGTLGAMLMLAWRRNKP